MALEFDSDFDGYFDTDAHAVACTYTPDGGSAASINVILDQEYLEIDEGTVGVNSTNPLAYGKAKDLKNAANGDTMAFAALKDLSGNTIKDAATYKIRDVQPDNHGIVMVVLEEQ